jgi:hypothetical protein
MAAATAHVTLDRSGMSRARVVRSAASQQQQKQQQQQHGKQLQAQRSVGDTTAARKSRNDQAVLRRR